ncbi:ferredoxin reductase family protein [Saccharospirillum salsuginis]|uniref:Oxidoreductase n=1 Tax=Saccharospirillum salsuginis TaxID=418750 RepID=A0A918JZR9_9GAMM|nr:ferredoxin reductase family protein [Saccharospirillum salsuginis]GGX40418.1 oxidoreductase [Saccharospirillum salsuginis]
MTLSRFKPGDVLIVAILAVLLGWHWSLWPELASGSSARVLDALGRLAGVLGLGLMLLAGIGSVRLPGLDRWFGGLPRLWTLHRLMGFGGFILILLHVWSMAFSGVAQSLAVALATLFPPISDWAIWSGWLALVLTVLFLAPTFQFFGRLHYQRWKRLHLLSAPALAFALVHTLSLSRWWPLWLVLGLLAFAAIGWRKLLSPHLGRSDWTVAEVQTLVPGVVELVLDPVDRPLRYEAGQFVYLTPWDERLAAGCGEEHPYTLSSAPDDPQLRLGIKDLGDATHALQTLTPGSRVQIEGPYGDFYERHRPGTGQLWLGGGIGITPFVSGARALRADGREDIQLFYLALDSSRAYYLDELKSHAERCPAFRVEAHYFRQEGPMTLAFLKQHCPDFAQREVYLCGPPGMVNHLKPLLLSAGVPHSALHSEVFDFL